MIRKKALPVVVGLFSIVAGLSACSRPDTTHTTAQLLPALLEVSDLPAEINSAPVEWQENMRKAISDPAPPWENTLDPYLCTEAGTPDALTMEQVQLELTGGSIMQILLSSNDADELYTDLIDAYEACSGTRNPSYEELTGIKKVGNESTTYKSADGVVTVARFRSEIMILKWWVGKYYDQVAGEYPNILSTAADKMKTL